MSQGHADCIGIGKVSSFIICLSSSCPVVVLTRYVRLSCNPTKMQRKNNLKLSTRVEVIYFGRK